MVVVLVRGWGGGGGQLEEVALDPFEGHRLDAREVVEAIGEGLLDGTDEAMGGVVEVHPVQPTDGPERLAPVALAEVADELSERRCRRGEDALLWGGLRGPARSLLAMLSQCHSAPQAGLQTLMRRHHLAPMHDHDRGHRLADGELASHGDVAVWEVLGD